MRFFHLSDLHIGKQLHSYPLKEEQEYILHQIIQKAEEYQPDAILICGDIFDKTVPSGEAYEIFDHFLMELAALGCPVLIIAGNHDSPQRLSYASSFLDLHQIYISTMPPDAPSERLKKVTLSDGYGEVDFYLFPFTKPAYVRHLFEEGVVTDYESAVKEILAREEIDFSRRNVLLSHQFYQAADWEVTRSDSEQIIVSVGGTDKVDVSLIRSFDYAALGHLHGPQRVKFPNVCYCGSPLKYSVSEEYHKKSIFLVTLEKKGDPVRIEKIPLVSIRDVKTEKGTLEEVLERGKQGIGEQDYVRVVLTDEQEPVHPKEKLTAVFSHLLEYKLDNQRTRNILTEKDSILEQLTPLEAFAAFYEDIHKVPLTKGQKELVEQVLDGLTDEEEQG